MIKKSKILSLNPYKKLIPDKPNVYVGLVDPSEAILKRAGFSALLESGETVLPPALGKASRYNAYGKRIVHKDQPMETAYRTVDWHWTEWHGTSKVEKSDFRDVPYKRYPRTDVTPPSLELSIQTNTDGKRVVMSPLITDWKNNPDQLLHAINLLLDIFGECTFFDEDLNQVITAPMKHLNWKILPKGEHPFSELQTHLKSALNRIKPGNRSFVDHRLERLNGFKPDFTAIGQGGFTGYVVFGYPDKDTYVLESILYGNATYVVGKDWGKLSKMTKAEILNDNLHKQRIIHKRNWFEKVRQLFSE
jgi:hypothetical protein